ncbi:MAG TPA: hypothetical protein VK487_05520 [Candidatus Bathyarchaeia archaeon]|nr:hypothetical protein [Candidatus Bathyarchaeia archaeon]
MGGEGQKENEQESKEKELIDFEIPMAEIISNFKVLRKISADEYQGEHPTRDSTTEQDFCISISKNCWHYFRCNSGEIRCCGLLCRMVIRCDQLQKGALKGDLFLRTLKLAKKEGYDIELPEDEEIE